MPLAEMSSPATGVDSFQPVIAPHKAFSSTSRAWVDQKVLWSWQLMGLGVSQCFNSSSARTILTCVPQRAPMGSAPTLQSGTCLAIHLVLAFFPSLSCLPQLCFLGSLPKYVKFSWWGLMWTMTEGRSIFHNDKLVHIRLHCSGLCWGLHWTGLREFLQPETSGLHQAPAFILYLCTSTSPSTEPCPHETYSMPVEFN